MFGKKDQLLPKDLAARAEKLAPEKIEAEVKRIVSEKPKSQVPAGLGQWLRDPLAIQPVFHPMWQGASDLWEQQQLAQARAQAAAERRAMEAEQRRLMQQFQVDAAQFMQGQVRLR